MPTDPWYGKLCCDMDWNVHGERAPEYWWRSVLERLVMLCGPCANRCMSDGVPASQFVRGEIVAPGVWRPV